MFLSKLSLNPFSTEARRDLSDFYEMKRTLAHAFGEQYEESHVLFRIENCDNPQILVQSQIKPNWDYLKSRDNGQYLLKQVDTKEWEEVDFSEGDVFAFKLRANPTNNMDKKKIGIFDEEKQLEWIKDRRAATHDFKVIQVNITPEDIQKGKKFTGKPISIYTVVFSGYLQVIDKKKFKDAFLNGIGRSKRFGCGMLSLAKRKH